MKNALIAIDPLIVNKVSFEGFCETIRLFEKKRIYSRMSIASVIHPSQYLMPHSHYRKHVEPLAREVRKTLKAACRDEFPFKNLRVISSDTHANEDIVEHLSKYGRRSGADLLLVGSNDRKGLPYWFLGSFAETASLTAKIPILVFKNNTSALTFARRTNFVLGVDVAAPPSAQAIAWLVDLCSAADAKIHLLYVEPAKRPVVDRLQLRHNHDHAHKVLDEIKQAFEIKDVEATVSIKKETHSIALSVVDFADKKGSLLTIATTPKRSTVRRLLLGSTARRMLAMTKRPFLSLRIE